MSLDLKRHSNRVKTSLKTEKEYRKFKDKQGKTDEGKRKDWDYFDAMDAILVTNPPGVRRATVQARREADGKGGSTSARGERVPATHDGDAGSYTR